MSIVNRIAEFEKVTFSQFCADMAVHQPDVSENELKAIYENIKLPQRATKGSAGYDFYIPFELAELKTNDTVIIPTGVRARIDSGWMLMCCPRSGLGFKFRMRLNNTVGIIDSDYYNAKNEGHIMAKLSNENCEGKAISLEVGASFMQGIFLPYGITADDSADGERMGGFGSTSK